MATTEFTGLQLSADDIRQLTGWGDAMVEDYISVVEALNEIQTGGATNDEVLNALKELVEQHIGDDENPHATSLVNLIDTLINEVTLGNDDILIQSNGRWVNRPISDVISSCCKDLIIISAQGYDKILSNKKYFDIGLRLTVDELNTDYVALKVITLPPTGFSGKSITYDGVSRTLGSGSYQNIFWNANGTRFYQRYGGSSTQLGFRYQEVSTPYDISTWTFTSPTILLPAVAGSGNAVHAFWISKDGLTLVSQASNDLYQFDMTVAEDLTTATFTKSVLNGMVLSPDTYGVTPDNSGLVEWDWSTSKSVLYKYTILDDNDIDSVSLGSTYDLEPEYPPLDASPRGVQMSTDGTQLFICEDDNASTRHLKTFSVATPYDISSITLTNDLAGVLNYNATGGGFITWSYDGTKLYNCISGSVDAVYQYSSAAVGGGVTAIIHHDGDERLRTTSEGAYVTGILKTTGASAQTVLSGYATGSEPAIEYEGGLVYNSSVKRPSYFDDVKWNPLATKEEHDALQAEVDPLTDIQDHSTEPTGMFDRTESAIAFDDVTRTFSINRTGASFTYFVIGVIHEITTDLDIIIPDTEGFYYFYLDDDEVIKYVTAFDLRLITDWSWLGNIYWDATNKERVMLADERHGLTMDSDTHAHFHLSLGAQYISGLGVADINADASGNLDSSAQLSVSSGLIRDEDIPHIVPSYGLPANIPVIYREGANTYWRKKAADDFPVIYSGTAGYTGANGRLAYNEWTGTAWQLSEVTNNDFVLVHYYATNDIDSHMIAIQGQNSYASLGQARDGANEEITNIGNLPYQEWVPVATVIFQTGNTYNNTPKARIRSTDTGEDYIDWRQSAPKAGAPLGDHGALGGLGDDDHPQYHNDTRGDVRYYTKTLADSTFEPLDPTILKNANIGVNIEAYVAKNTAWNKNFGTGAGEVMEGNTPIASDFTGLSDTPANYTGSAGYQVFVNGLGTGLEFVSPSAGAVWGAITGVLSNQTDLQSALNGKEDSFSKNTAFNKNFGTTAGTVMEGDTAIPADFTDLNDTPASYTGQSGKVVVVNVGETGVEFATPLEYSSPRKNILMNTDFAINQRGYVDGTGASGFVYDRWRVDLANSTLSVSGHVATVDHTTASTNGQFYQGIEAGSLITGRQYTVSWKGTAECSVWYVNGEANVFKSSPFTFTAVGGTSTVDEYLTFRGDGATISELKIEEGTSATPWEKPDKATELARCQRYYWKASSCIRTLRRYSTSSTHDLLVPYPVVMRTTPTVTVTASNIAGYSTQIYPDVCRIVWSGTETGTSRFISSFTASAELN